jgi:hypothetical protein
MSGRPKTAPANVRENRHANVVTNGTRIAVNVPFVMIKVNATLQQNSSTLSLVYVNVCHSAAKQVINGFQTLAHAT